MSHCRTRPSNAILSVLKIEIYIREYWCTASLESLRLFWRRLYFSRLLISRCKVSSCTLVESDKSNLRLFIGCQCLQCLHVHQTDESRVWDLFLTSVSLVLPSVKCTIFAIVNKYFSYYTRLVTAVKTQYFINISIVCHI